MGIILVEEGEMRERKEDEGALYPVAEIEICIF